MPRSVGVTRLEDGSTRWRVWAPRAKGVEVVLIDGGQRRAAAMQVLPRGWFEHVETNVAEGSRYGYRLDGGPERPDPASLWQPDGVHQPSAVLMPQRFDRHDAHWKGVPRDELVFYELHVGAFTPEGTFDAVVPRLPELKELGVTAIELMPVAQFPGTRGWGYDGVHPFAPQNSYGGPHGLRRLVDACHVAGLAIFLDMVYNHLGPEGNYLHEFGPYFTDRYRTPWGSAFNFDSAGCDFVRDFVLDNVRLWLDEYYFDGLRLDAVHAIYDFSAHHILQAIKETADEIAAQTGRHIHIVAESSLNDVRILRDPRQGGYGLDAQWNDDFHHTLHAYLTGDHQGYYADFGKLEDFPKLFEKTFILDGGHSVFRDRKHGAPIGELPGDRFVVSIQNHDQIGNRAQGERLRTLLSRDRQEAVAQGAQRLAASLMLFAPHLPLFFMGEEYGEDRPFLFFCSFLDPNLIEAVRTGRREEFASFAWQGEVPDPNAESTFEASKLSWSWLDGTFRAGLRRLYQDLLVARRIWPALRDFQNRSATLDPSGVLHLIRGGQKPEAGKTLQIHANLTERAQVFLRPSSFDGEMLLFSSEWMRYQGGRQPSAALDTLLPYECVAFGAEGRE
jgi:maltooligosyltrehalose trehalohydrolase